jgi:GPH family glycoside/pentoside/hexuronide:cation symporter
LIVYRKVDELMARQSRPLVSLSGRRQWTLFNMGEGLMGSGETGDPSNAAITARARVIPRRLKIGYAFGAWVDCIVSNALGVFVLFYLTAVCGMSGVYAGVALSAGLVVDAIVDPLIGALSDDSRGHWGRRLPFMVAGILPVSVTFIGLFAIPKGLTEPALAVVVAATVILLRVFVSMFNLPYLALGAEITDNYTERSQVAAWRWGIGMIGAMLSLGLAFGVCFNGREGLLSRQGYLLFGVGSAVFVALGGTGAILTAALLRDRSHVVAAPRATVPELFRDLREVMSNSSFRALFSSALLFFTAQTMAASVMLHANTFFWRLSLGQVQVVTFATFAGQIVGAPVVSAFVARVEKRTALIVGLGGLIVTQAGPPTIRLLGGLRIPAPLLAYTLAGNAFFGGVLVALAVIALGSMMADAADEHEVEVCKRREGLFFAGWSFAAKAAAGFGALASGVALQLIGFPQNLSAHGGLHAVLPAEVAWRLGVLVGPVAGFLSLAGVLALVGYRLNRRAHEGILAVLHERRSQMPQVSNVCTETIR